MTPVTINEPSLPEKEGIDERYVKEALAAVFYYNGKLQRCWLFLKNMAHNGALKMFISCTESSHQIARTPVRQTPPV